MIRYLLYSKEYGVFLGCFFGLGFWSNFDNIYHDEAYAFSSLSEAVAYVASFPSEISDLVYLEVESYSQHVPHDKCVRAGVPPWIPESILHNQALKC